MSLNDLFDADIQRRKETNTQLQTGQADIVAAIEQFNQLDEVFRTNEKVSRDHLIGVYKENKHYTGNATVVYSSAQVEKYPFFSLTDAVCNPYFPITKFQDGTFDGLAPLLAPITRTGAYARLATYTPIEPTLRNTALTALQAFPNTSAEIGTGGGCTGGTGGANQVACVAGGGTWTNPTYPPGSTATEKLKVALDPWKAEVVALMADLYNDTGSAEFNYWQNILNKINDILPSIQTNVSWPTHTSDFTNGSTPDLARDYLVANISSINTHVVNRTAFLTADAEAEEVVFFGIVKLRLHQVNGSYAKLQAVKTQKSQNQSIVNDNIEAIRSLNLLKVKNS